MTAYRTALAGISAALVVACAHRPPEKQPPAVSVPVPLIRDVCAHAHLEQGSGHWDGGAMLQWNKEGAVVAIDCSFTVFVDGLSTATVRVSLQDESARGLREFLESRAGSH